MIGVQVSGNVIITDNKVIVDGKEYDLPKCKSSCHSSTVINNKVYINGYELKKGKWRRTLKALFYTWF